MGPRLSEVPMSRSRSPLLALFALACGTQDAQPPADAPPADAPPVVEVDPLDPLAGLPGSRPHHRSIPHALFGVFD